MQADVTRWYLHLAPALADAPDHDLAGHGRYDVLADPRQSTVAASALPDARVRVLPTSHFLPLEAPRVVVDELELLVARVLTADSRTSS
jgi:pimeloyl-ACP methyl ester carboxylesterase